MEDPNVNQMPEDDLEKIQERRRNSEKEWERLCSDKLCRNNIDLETKRYVDGSAEEKQKVKEILRHQYIDNYGRPVDASIQEMGGRDTYSKETLAIITEDEVISAVGKWSGVFQLIMKDESISEEILKEIAGIILKESRHNSLILQGPEGEGSEKMIELTRDELWKVKEMESDPEDDFPEQNYLVIPDKPVGLEIILRTTRYDTKLIEKVLSEHLDKIEPKLSLIIARHGNKCVTITIPFKGESEDYVEYFVIHGSKRQEMVEAIGSAMEELGAYVEYSENMNNISGPEVSIQQMITGSLAHKTRESGWYDGTNRLDRPW